MPKMDGLTLAMNLTERHPNCKVLMMTGLPHDAITHPDFGKFEFLHKPIPLSLLLDKVAEAIGIEEGNDVDQDSEPL